MLHPGVFDRNWDIVPVKQNQEASLLSSVAFFRGQLLQATVQEPCSSGLGLEEAADGTVKLPPCLTSPAIVRNKKKKGKKRHGSAEIRGRAQLFFDLLLCCRQRRSKKRGITESTWDGHACKRLSLGVPWLWLWEYGCLGAQHLLEWKMQQPGQRAGDLFSFREHRECSSLSSSQPCSSLVGTRSERDLCCATVAELGSIDKGVIQPRPTLGRSFWNENILLLYWKSNLWQQNSTADSITFLWLDKVGWKWQ